MKNYIAPGDALELTIAADVSSGDPVLVGDIFGVVAFDVDVSVDPVATVNTKGVFDLPRTAADTFTQGLAVFFNSGAGEITTDAAAGANKLVGVATEAKAPGAGTVKVKLNESAVA